ncbi:DUF2147 domain-containing protein [Algoriphagus taiwanensis]|uniref:DUF2147 domain-containing protein n=1 Tax=Algoriphagus taiwanensis TaxID=1445656 RepID=A0ABQ6PY54_9BACT|nr:DUF2147 domain-containing protein [Algoriphagus taiwanensis]
MKMRQFTSLFLVLFVFLVGNALGQTENAILGVWYNTEKDAKVQIEKKGDAYFGKIIWLREPIRDGKPVVDSNNSDSKLQSRPILGMTILEGLKYSGGAWKNGKIYDPKSGNTYSCELKLTNKGLLEVKGYMGFSFIGRTVEWSKAE